MRKVLVSSFSWGFSIVMLASGCGVLNDQQTSKERHPPVKVATHESRVCIENLGQDIRAWFKDGSGDIGASVDCTVAALDEFTRKVVGTHDASSYTANELTVFLKDFLAQGNSDLGRDAADIVTETLKLKRLFIGGSDTSFSKSEFALIRHTLIRLKPKIVALSAHIPLIFFAPKTALPGQASAAAHAVNDLIVSFAREIAAAEGGRPTWTAEELLACIRKLGFENGSVDRYLPLFETAKSILVGGAEGAIDGSEWTAVI
jgi:hypothetical protein